MALNFCSLSSGSSGNCIYLESGTTKILIDAGLSGKRIQELMKQVHVDPSSLDAILVTHEHVDHIKGVGILSRRFDLPIIANYETWLAMEKPLGKIAEKNIVVCNSDAYFRIKDMDIFALKTFHDSAQALGFVVTQGRSKATILTDTGYVNERMKNFIRDSNLFYIEANHDLDMLYNGPYPEALKKRIASTRGHLSNADSASVLSDILRGNEEKIILAHLSEENNDPSLCYQTIHAHLQGLGLDMDRDVDLSVAPRYVPGTWIQL